MNDWSGKNARHNDNYGYHRFLNEIRNPAAGRGLEVDVTGSTEKCQQWEDREPAAYDAEEEIYNLLKVCVRLLEKEGWKD